jgi:hypothetical protein
MQSIGQTANMKGHPIAKARTSSDSSIFPLIATPPVTGEPYELESSTI